MKGMLQGTQVPTAAAATAFAASCVLALVVGWQDWRRLAAPPSPSLRAVAGQDRAVGRPAADDTHRAALARLPGMPLFGTAAAAPATHAVEAPREAEADLPESNASFEVFGLIEARNPAQARAILGTGEADQREYRVGDAAPDGARLHDIRPRALVLEREGRLELMKLPEPESGEASAVPAVRPRFQARPVARLAPRPRPPAPPGSAPAAPPAD